jgi:glycosyltransferase involved in cell wall biosynthesis
MNISIISLVFPPETGSARRVGELAAFLSQQGHNVSVITGFPSYPKGVVFNGYKKTLIQKSQWEGKVNLYRVYLYTSPKRKHFVHRMSHYLTFTISACLAGMLTISPDIIYVVSPPYFLGISGWFISRLRNARLAFDVQDFWPEAPISLGYVKNPILIKILMSLEEFIYKKSNVIFALSNVMKEKIIGRGVLPQKVVLVYNWVDSSKFAPVSGDELRNHLGLKDKFIILFAGNMGQAQGLDMVIDAAKLLEEQSKIVFILLGDGIERPRLEEKVYQMGLKNVRFIDAVPENQVPPYLGMADVLLVTLGRAKHREAAIPSKIQVYMASAKPLLVAAEGDAAQIVHQANCGLTVSPDDPRALSAAIMRLQAMSQKFLLDLGETGRRYALTHFDLSRQCQLIESRLMALLEK